MFTHRRNTSKHQLDGMENFLANQITPVKPSTEFVRHLGDRLTSYPQPVIEYQSNTLPLWQYTILAFASVVGGGLVLAILFRFIIKSVSRMSSVRPRI